MGAFDLPSQEVICPKCNKEYFSDGEKQECPYCGHKFMLQGDGENE